MKFCIVQSHNLRCIFSRSFGLYRADDVRLMVEISASMDLVRAGAPAVNDMRFVDFRVAVSEIMAIKDVPFDKIETGIRRRVAFVAGSAFGRERLQVLASLREHDIQTTGVFDSFGEAFRYVERPVLGDALPQHIDDLLNEAQSPDEQESDSFRIVMKRA